MPPPPPPHRGTPARRQGRVEGFDPHESGQLGSLARPRPAPAVPAPGQPPVAQRGLVMCGHGLPRQPPQPRRGLRVPRRRRGRLQPAHPALEVTLGPGSLGHQEAVLPVQAVGRLGQARAQAASDEVTLNNSGQSLQCI